MRLPCVAQCANVRVCAHALVYTDVRECVCAGVRVCMCANVCACVCNYEESTMLRIFPNSIITRTLYARVFIFIFAMWDFVSCFKCTGDLAA